MRIRDIKKAALERMNECFPQLFLVMMIFLGTHLFFVFAEIASIQLLELKGAEINILALEIPTALIIITLIRIVGEFTIIAPINVGVSWWLIHCVRGETNNVRHILICFSNGKIYLKSLLLRLIVFVIKLFMTIPIVLCAYIMYSLSKASVAADSESGGSYVALIACCALLLICLSLLFLWLTSSFCLVNFLFAANPDEKVVSCIAYSVEAMHGHKFEVVKLIASYLGWIIAVFFVFPLFFALPYAATGYGILMDKIMQREIYAHVNGNLNRSYSTRK